MSHHAERAFFDGDHCQHMATRDENMRLRRIAEVIARDRRRNGRAGR